MNPVQYFDNEEEKVFQTFDRTKSMIADDVKTIQEWMKTQPHLPKVMDDNYIINFLILTKFSLEIAKERIDCYYTVSKRFSELAENISPTLPHMKQVFDAVYSFPLPKLTKDLSRVWIYKVREPSEYVKIKHHTFNGNIINWAEVSLMESLHLNDIFIFDFANIHKESLTILVPSILQKMMIIYNKVYRCFKAAYIVNASPLIDHIMTVIKMIVKPKILERIYFCKEVSELVTLLPKEILPKDYGGEERSLEELNNLAKLKMMEHHNRLTEIHNMKIDESLRPEKLENDDFLGFHGNFKKLDFD